MKKYFILLFLFILSICIRLLHGLFVYAVVLSCSYLFDTPKLEYPICLLIAIFINELTILGGLFEKQSR